MRSRISLESLETTNASSEGECIISIFAWDHSMKISVRTGWIWIGFLLIAIFAGCPTKQDVEPSGDGGSASGEGSTSKSAADDAPADDPAAVKALEEQGATLNK